MTNIKTDLILIYGPGPVAAAVKSYSEHGPEGSENLTGEALECFKFLYPDETPAPEKKTKPAPAKKPHKPGPQNEVPKKEPEPEPAIIEDPTPEPEPIPEPEKKKEPTPDLDFIFDHDRKKTNLFKTDLWRCCGKDELRPAFMRVNFKNGFAYATDAHILCKQSLKHIHGFSDDMVQAIEGRQLLADDFKKLSGPGTFLKMDDEGIWYMDKQKTKCFVPWAEPEKYPDVDAVIPTEDFKALEAIGLNPELVSRLGEAMATNESKGIKLTFKEVNKPVLVHGLGIPAEFQTGIIMPMMIKEN